MKAKTQAAQQRSALEQAVATALEFAAGKADAAEVMAGNGTGIDVTTRYGEAESVEFNNGGAMGITVYKHQCKGSASSNDFSPQAIARTVQAALDIASHTTTDPFSGIADSSLLAYNAPDLDLFHPHDISPQQALDLAAQAEQTALQADPRIINTEGGNFTSHQGVYVFGNSHGMLQSYCTSKYLLSARVIAGQNDQMERDYGYSVNRVFTDLHSPQWVGEECARRTLARLSPQKLTTMKTPVLFSREMACGLLGHLISAIHGKAIYRKSSFLLDDLGREIFPRWLQIEEQPHLRQGLGSAPFDHEGVATRRQHIIRDGVLQQWLLDSYSARKLNLTSNGHSGGAWNWLISHSELDFPALLKQMDRGLLVTELMGQGVNPVTGDYSRGASGFWVENGQLQYPVSEITIAGNLKTMWRNIVAIGNDTEQRHTLRCGSTLIAEMQVAGG